VFRRLFVSKQVAGIGGWKKKLHNAGHRDCTSHKIILGSLCQGG
jgi:hypothetical protein